MRMRLLLAFLLFSPLAAFSQSYFGVNGWCTLGAQATVTQGLSSSGTKPLSGGNFSQASGVLASYPKCTIAVYSTGTTNLATIYSNTSGNVLSNPFTGATDGSFLFFGLAGCYDIVTSSGVTTGSTMPANKTYSDVCIGIGGSGSTTVNCPVALNGSIGAFTAPTAFSCDPNFFTDFQGNFTAQSGQFIGPVNGFITLIGGGSAPGGQVKFKLPANTFRMVAPTAVGTSYYFVPPATRCTPGQVWGLLSETTDGNGDFVDTYQCQNSAASGTEVQVNGVDTTAQTPINFQNSSTVTFTNTSSGNIQASVGGAQMATPVAPTLSTNGSAGSTSYTYKVVGCQDGPTCAYHTPATGATTIATGNATLTSGNSINITAYGDTLYGPRCYNIYRTASAGTPATTGLIANCVWKSFIDTGLTGDGTTAPTTNTTVLDINGLTAPLPGCNKVPAAPWGIDGPPCVPNALDDEFTWGGSFTPGDSNDPFWAFQNQGSITATLTNGLVSITGPSQAGDQIHCLMQAVPTAPYAFTALVYPNASMQDGTTTPGTNVMGGLGFFETVSGKYELLGLQQSNSSAIDVRTIYVKWTNSTTVSTQAATAAVDAPSKPFYLRLQNDGTNLKAYTSVDGITYVLGHTELLANFFTAAPTKVGFCVDVNTMASSTYTLDVDYWRRTQ